MSLLAILIQNRLNIQSCNIDFTTLPDNKYTTAEQDTGQKWIDGRPIYRKVVRGAVNMTGNSTSRLAHGIQGLTNRWELIKYYNNIRQLSLGKLRG